jgi:hypothetical protein
MSRTTLASLLKEHNQVIHATKRAHHLPTEIQATMGADLKCLNHHIAHAVSHAKAVWYADVCSKIHDTRMKLHLAWAHIHLLAKGKSAHHQQKTTMAMHLPDDTRATNASENMSVLSPHFHKVINTHRMTDPSLLEHILQQ